MTLADIFLTELEKHGLGNQPLASIGRELAKRYNANLETLSAIAADYVKVYHELEDIKDDPGSHDMLAALEQIRGFASVMEKNNWRDMRLHIERQCSVIKKAIGK